MLAHTTSENDHEHRDILITRKQRHYGNMVERGLLRVQMDITLPFGVQA